MNTQRVMIVNYIITAEAWANLRYNWKFNIERYNS